MLFIVVTIIIVLFFLIEHSTCDVLIFYQSHSMPFGKNWFDIKFEGTRLLEIVFINIISTAWLISYVLNQIVVNIYFATRINIYNNKIILCLVFTMIDFYWFILIIINIIFHKFVLQQGSPTSRSFYEYLKYLNYNFNVKKKKKLKPVYYSTYL